MSKPRDIFGYSDVTINKHGGNEQSNQANVKVSPYKLNWSEKVLALMATRDAAGKGTTVRDAGSALGKEKNEISPRFTQLKTCDPPRIEPTGFVEDGFMVYRLAGSTNVAKKEN